MRYGLTLIALVLIITMGCKIKKPAAEIRPSYEVSQASNGATDFSEQSTWLLGYLNPPRLSQPPYSEWYQKGYEDYIPEQDIITKLQALNKDDLSILVVMGTWCPDSRREVPRFMKIIDQWQFPGERITFIGVDGEKLSPLADFDKLDIQRVPTFIVMKNKIETGRIIENPVASLEKDLLEILTRNE
jgi:thiol-disulfide isomerase/thioredoxin